MNDVWDFLFIMVMLAWVLYSGTTMTNLTNIVKDQEYRIHNLEEKNKLD